MSTNFAIIGGDLRIIKLAKMLAKDGNKVYTYGLEKAEKDTYDMSKEAMGIIKSIGHNEYLEELINMLIHRNK